MTPFSYHKPASVSEAVSLADPSSRFIAGGTNLVDLMKENVVRPELLIDISGLGLNGIHATANAGVLIGALVSNADLAWHPMNEDSYNKKFVKKFDIAQSSCIYPFSLSSEFYQVFHFRLSSFRLFYHLILKSHN